MKNIRATYTRYEPAKSLDYYATDPKAADYLLAVETFSHTVWEPACGGLHLSKRIEKHGYRVINSDIVQRAENVTELDFLNYYPKEKNELDIITNPPYNKAAEFIKHALDISRGG